MKNAKNKDEDTIFYIYHIPGKKIGVTRNLRNRVTLQQGYAPSEYEVLDHSKDIDYISKRETELQQSYGYKVDRDNYKNLNFKMKINATETTTTFPYPLNKLKGNLMDNIGTKWETKFGTFELNPETVKWIDDCAQTSMYNTKRSFIYNKSFFEKFLNQYEKASKDIKKFSNKIKEYNKEEFEALQARLVSIQMGADALPTELLRPHLTHGDQEVIEALQAKNTTLEHEQTYSRFQKIRDWAKERGLYDKGDTKTQFCKLMEEAGELGRAVLKNDHEEFVDAIGDMVVVLTNLAHLGNTTIEHCVDSAYDEIKNRKGAMKNGTFVKDK